MIDIGIHARKFRFEFICCVFRLLVKDGNDIYISYIDYTFVWLFEELNNLEKITGVGITVS